MDTWNFTGILLAIQLRSKIVNRWRRFVVGDISRNAPSVCKYVSAGFHTYFTKRLSCAGRKSCRDRFAEEKVGDLKLFLGLGF